VIIFFVKVAQAGPMADAPRLSTLVGNVLGFVLSIVGVIAVLMIVVAGIMYMSAAGDMGRIALAKRALTGGVIGLVVALLALVIVRTITALV
jgi:type IV secretory pathway VirB2 component (pilin)